MPREKKELEPKETKTKCSTKSKSSSKSKTEKKEEDQIVILMKQIEELQKQINKNTKEEIVEEKTKRKKRATFQDIRDEEVFVKRVIGGIGGVLYIDKKTGDEYRWNEEGSTEYMTVDVLKRMNNKSSLFLKAPWVRIDEDHPAIDVLGLRELYKNIDSIEDIDSFIEMRDDEILRIINSLNQAYKDTLATNIIYKIASNELTDINVIRRLERLLGKTFLD